MKIVIYPHSHVDLITNSSTEIFIANRGHTLEQVKEIVKIVKEVFYYTDPYDSEISIEEASGKWDLAYYGEGAIIISAEQGSIHFQMAQLMEKIFDSGERNEDADY